MDSITTIIPIYKANCKTLIFKMKYSTPFVKSGKNIKGRSPPGGIESGQKMTANWKSG
jgi:hypothetical protein